MALSPVGPTTQVAHSAPDACGCSGMIVSEASTGATFLSVVVGAVVVRFTTGGGGTGGGGGSNLNAPTVSPRSGSVSVASSGTTTTAARIRACATIETA